MEVVKDNFEEALQLFQENLSQSEIVSLDLEFTGIHGKPEQYNDSMSERYSKIRRVAMNYEIIQVGLCLFIRNGDIWETRPFNFYVFPEDSGANTRVTLEVSAISFLKEHNMDFNKWIYQGIPYMTMLQESDLHTKLISVQDEPMEQLVLSKPNDIARMKEIEEKINQLLSGSDTYIEINGLNAYLRRYLYTELRKNYPNIFPESVKTEGSRDVTMRLHKVDPEAAQRMKEEKESKKKFEFNERIGFRRVFTLLEQAKKPLIVHSGLYDLAFFIDGFYGDLPEKYSEFKSLVHSLFPIVYDTRYILERHPGLWEEFDQSSSLKGLSQFYSFLCKDEFRKISLAAGFEKYRDERYAHEAGFDALMCGTCFLWLIEKIGNLDGYRNLVPAFKSFFALNLEGEDIIFPENYFYFKGADIKKTFGALEGFSWRYIKDDECFVQSVAEEKLIEFRRRAEANNWTLIAIHNYFNSKVAEI